MAENEVLDFGHATRWRKSRSVLRDAQAVAEDFVEAATQDCEGAIRNLPKALRRGPPLLVLVKALRESILAQQEAISAFTEKRLANVVIAVAKCSKDSSAEQIAGKAADRMLETLVDQVLARALKERRFCASHEQAELRESLTRKFAAYQPPLAQAIESSLRGLQVKPVKLPRRFMKRRPEEVAVMSLITPKRPEPRELPHVRR